MSLYTDLIEAGQQVEHHDSDLYCKVNDVTRDLMKKHDIRPEVFRSETDGKLWFDAPFQYDPFWERRK